MTRRGEIPAPADFSDVEAFDNSFRWWVRSRTNPGKRWLTDLSNYGGHGRCSCPDFEKHFEKFLSRGFTPQQVFEAGQVQLRPYHLGVNDALSCWHLCRARQKLAHAFVQTLKAAQAAQAASPRR